MAEFQTYKGYGYKHLMGLLGQEMGAPEVFMVFSLPTTTTIGNSFYIPTKEEGGGCIVEPMTIGVDFFPRQGRIYTSSLVQDRVSGEILPGQHRAVKALPDEEIAKQYSPLLVVEIFADDEAVEGHDWAPHCLMLMPTNDVRHHELVRKYGWKQNVVHGVISNLLDLNYDYEIEVV